MPYAVIAAAIFTLVMAFQVRNSAHKPVATPSPDLVENTVVEEMPSPSIIPISTKKPSPIVSPKPQVVNSASTPQPTSAGQPQKSPLMFSSPSPKSDQQPPVFESITGPEDGSTIDFVNFCFPMKLTDNSGGPVWVRYSFDNSGVSDWNQNFAPCYQNVSNGFHFFIVQGKDASGNLTEYVSRNFTVNSDAFQVNK